jgi:hypothetical protein
MTKLKEPSEETATRIREEVGFDHRLTGYRMHPRLGPTPANLYSFEEVAAFLEDPMSQVDYDELIEWMRDVMDDQELAGRIKTETQKNTSPLNKNINIRRLMEQRLLQCRRIT